QRVVIRERACQRSRQRTSVSFRAQAKIDAIGLTSIGVSSQEANNFTSHPREEIVVGNEDDAPAAGRALVVVNEHQIDVAAVIELIAAELAEGHDDASGRLTVGGEGLTNPRAHVTESGS